MGHIGGRGGGEDVLRAANESGDGGDADDGAARGRLGRHLRGGGVYGVEGAGKVRVVRLCPELGCDPAHMVLAPVHPSALLPGGGVGTHSRNSLNSHIPALLTTTSSRPHRLTTSATSFFPVSASPTSPGTSASRLFASSLLPSMLAASSRSVWYCSADFASPKWLTAMLAPCARYASAMARPIPVTPPVMAVDLPLRSCAGLDIVYVGVDYGSWGGRMWGSRQEGLRRMGLLR